MSSVPEEHLSRRERQIMNVLHRLGRATAAEIQTELPDPPGYSAVRSALSLLEEKGAVHHERTGSRYVYTAATPRRRTLRTALQHLLGTFFGGSHPQAVSALLEDSDCKLSEPEYQRLAQLLDEARRRGGEA